MKGHPLNSGHEIVRRLRADELRRRRRFPTPRHRAADAYLVRRGDERTILAGYPWFTDWGRDTFVAVRGLCIASGRLEDARGILLSWAGAVSLGMVPNRFPDRGEHPEYNAVDASLWYVVAVHEFLAAVRSRRFPFDAADRSRLVTVVERILESYTLGSRHRILATADGLLTSGEPGVQLTWMDAKVGDRVVTPRVGKPVEVQALWVNALWIGSRFDRRWQAAYRLARTTFEERFWCDERQFLFDVLDCDHVDGRHDATLRPNQILAVGGLPLTLLDGARARSVVKAVEDHLLTPRGLRSLAAGEPGYTPRYEGGVGQRDAAYHQGTVWPWLVGPFVEAWLRVNGNTPAHRREARRRFVAPLLTHLGEAGLGHVSEIVDAEHPHTPRGCPWQAWSLAELLRLEYRVLAEPKTPRGISKQARRLRSSVPRKRKAETPEPPAHPPSLWAASRTVEEPPTAPSDGEAPRPRSVRLGATPSPLDQALVADLDRRRVARALRLRPSRTVRGET